MSVNIKDGKAGKQVPSILDLQGREFEEKPEAKENLDSPAEVGEEPRKPAENGHPLLAVGVFSADKQDTHDDVPISVPYGDESEVKMAEPLKLEVQQVNASRSDLENSSLKRLFLLDVNGEGSNSGTKEEQSLFLKELEKFSRERSMEFKPPKLKGKGVNYLKLWRAVMRRGGYDKVTSGKLWGQVGKSLRSPKTCKAGSWTCRSFYEKVLLDFEREKFLAGELHIPASSTVEPLSNENQVGSNVGIPVVQSDNENQVSLSIGIPVAQSDNENQVCSSTGIPVAQSDNENQVCSSIGIPVAQSDNENQVCSSIGIPVGQSNNENQVCSSIGIPVGQSNNENQVCSSIGIPVAQSDNENQASASGRTPRDAAARARLRWCSKCSLGNGEVSIPLVKEKRASSAKKRENCTESSLKRKNRSVEEDAVSTIQQETSESRGDIAAVDVGLPTDEAKEDEQKTVSSPEFASVAQLKEAAEKALVVLQTQEQTLSMDTLDMLAPHLKVLMSSSAPIEVALTCKRFEMVMTDQLLTFVEAKRRKVALEEEIESTRESLESTSRCRESLVRSSSARKRLAGLEDQKHELEREISCLSSERARVETEIEGVRDELRLIDDVAEMERGRSIARDRLIKEMALAEMSTCQGEAALSSLKTILTDAVKKARVEMKFN